MKIVRASVALAAVLAASLVSSAAHAEGLAAGEAEAPAPLPPAGPTSIYTENGLLGPVRLGPSVGIGAPDGLRFGLFAKWRGILAFGGALSTVPEMGVPGLDAKVTRLSGEVFTRVHPFRGAFFAGVAGGYAQTKGSMVEQSIQTQASASALYIAPQLGFQWMLPKGITVGFDFGVQIPLATTGPNIEATRNGVSLPAEATNAVTNATRYLTTMPVPVVHLLEVGWAL